MSLNTNLIRSQFPALESRDIFFDNPAGTQVPRSVVDRMTGYLLETNANHGGVFKTSKESDAVIDKARAAAADFLNAPGSESIVFGPNMTSLTFNISRSIAATLRPGDKIAVTRLDHDANITPWTRIAEDRSADVIHVDFDIETGTLSMDSLEKALEEKPRLLAVGYASNALGTINPIKKITRMAHDAGALVYVDAVQYAPHGPIDVQDLDVDFLVCSAYKFFGPHVGVLYGRFELLDELRAYRVLPAPSDPPGKFETGTGNFEGYAGVLGALEYLEWLGTTFGSRYMDKYNHRFTGRALHLKQAMAAIRAYEYELSRAMVEILTTVPAIRLYGLNDMRTIDQRVPTFAFRAANIHPKQIAEELSNRGIYVWNGNYYALAVTTRLGIEESGGMVRVGPVHYNTLEEIARFAEAILEIV